MSDRGGAQGGDDGEDPSMEDILASIRRILNDDEPQPADKQPSDKQPGDFAEPGNGKTVQPSAGGVSQDDVPEDDVFVLDQTMLIEEPAAMSTPDPFDSQPFAPEHLAPEPAASVHVASASMPPPEPVASRPDPFDDEPLTNPTAAAAAVASMGALVRVVNQQQAPVYRGGPTLEDMVRDEIRSLVKSWLDDNLAPMVERMVRAEIARVTGSKAGG